MIRLVQVIIHLPVGRTVKLAEVAPLGFVTPYAGSKPSEDIAEVTACFLTYPEAQWGKCYDSGWRKR